MQERVEARRVEGRHVLFLPRLLPPSEDLLWRRFGRLYGLRYDMRTNAAPAAPGVVVQAARGAVGPLPEVLDGGRRLRWTDGRFWGRRPRGRIQARGDHAEHPAGQHDAAEPDGLAAGAALPLAVVVVAARVLLVAAGARAARALHYLARVFCDAVQCCYSFAISAGQSCGGSGSMQCGSNAVLDAVYIGCSHSKGSPASRTAGGLTQPYLVLRQRISASYAPPNQQAKKLRLASCKDTSQQKTTSPSTLVLAP